MSTSSSDLWIETDHNGVIVGWAADIVRLTGYSARSMFGLLLKIMFSADGACIRRTWPRHDGPASAKGGSPSVSR